VNLGSGRPRTLREIVDALAAALATEVTVEVEPAAHFEVASTWADTRRFEALAGFRPQTDLRDVVARFLAADALVGAR
jgi:UDP-glucuronate 4-epimerase